jgi:hypothetical protein
MKSFYKLLIVLISTTTISLFSASKEVEIGTSAGANVTYYSFSKGVILSDPLAKWNIALMNGIDACVRINDATNHQLWLVGKKSASDFGKALDTTGMGTWQELHNSDTTWNIGAFNIGKDGFDAGDGDYGWGVYDPSTHYIVGNKLFVLRINASTCKQVLIDGITAGEFTIKYANLDGTNPKTVVVNKADFAGKNFVGLSMIDDKVYDKEPLSKDWDIAGTKYWQLTPDGQGNLLWYSVFGFLSNSRPTKVTGQSSRIGTGLKVAQVDNVDMTTNTMPSKVDYSSSINQIGSDWKVYNGTYSFPKRVYFAQRFDSLNAPSGLVYKFSFTKYAGNSTTFTQEDLVTSVNEDENSNISNAVVYPNEITKNESLNLVITSKIPNFSSEVKIYNSTGNLVCTRKINLNSDFGHIILNNLDLNLGLYFIQIGENTFKTPLMFIVK